MRFDTAAQRQQMVAAFQNRDDAAAAALIRKLADDARQLGIALLSHRQRGQRIVAMGIEAGRDQDELRPEGQRLRSEFLIKRANQFVIARAGRQRHVQGEAGPCTPPHLIARAGSGIAGVLVRAEVQDGRVVVEDVLGAVAVVDIPIDEEEAR